MNTIPQITDGPSAPRYLLIAGAPKAATTSLFRYLADHPDVCQANRKETYFFAREFDEKQVCSVDETLEAFQTYFTHSNDEDKLRVEATPYTLYSHNVAPKIAKLLPNAKILVLLRDPVRRLFSDFKFQKQRAVPTVQEKSFEAYIHHLIENQTDELDQLGVGRYIDFLNPFYDAFGEEKIMVIFYEELRANLEAEMKKLSVLLNIDPNYYADYQFNIHNKTITVRYEWLNQLRLNLEPRVASMREVAINNGTLHRVFEKIVDVGRTTITHINDHKQPKADLLTPKARATLTQYYHPFNQALAKKLGRSLPQEWHQKADHILVKDKPRGYGRKAQVTPAK